jgi:tetratricopeptide (TPR) repeat protein
MKQQRRLVMNKWKLLAPMIATALLAFADVPPTSAGDDRVAELFESSFAHEVSGNVDRSLGQALDILKIEKDNYIATYRVAWLYYLEAKYAESTRYYRAAVALKPGALEPRLAMMLPLMAAKKWSEAEKLGEELLKLAPRNYLAGSRLAFSYFSQGKYSAAEKQYRAVLDNFPSELEMMLGLGWTFLKQGRKAEAREMFEAVLAVRRHNRNALAGLEAL